MQHRKMVLIGIAAVVAAILLPATSVRAGDVGLGFTGISVDVQGVEGADYAVERLWFDRQNDDDVILYVKSTAPIALLHNANNVVDAAQPWTPGLDPGTIVYKIDGDGLRGYSGNIYHAAPANGNPINPPLDAIQFQYSAPFTLAGFKGQVGQGPDFYRGIVDSCGDQWHVLTLWDVDPANSEGQRDDQTNDGKVVLLVVDPQTPCIAFSAAGDEQYYTTPPKLYYTPHIQAQKTYLTSGVQITLTNITNGEPSQERCMYSDGRITINAAVAYDLIAGTFTRQNGYATGLTAIEHIKIRDNIAGEAVMMVQFPTSIPEPFWRTSRASGSPRNLQLEMFFTSLAMAVPSYDTHYFGTSGTDGTTQATHPWTPLPDTAITWIELNNSGYVEHPTDPSRFRHSALWNLIDEDGSHVGQARDGYLTMMHQDVIPFLDYRLNFDGHHYERFEKYLMMRLLQRYPFNSATMPQGFFEGGYNSPDSFLGDLVRPEYDDAPQYLWSLYHPNTLSGFNIADPSVQQAAIPFNSRVTRSYAVFSSDLGDPQAVMMRMRVFPPDYWCESGTFQTYLGGAFNICGYGQRLVIEKAGYHREDYQFGTSMQRKSVIMVDGQNDPSYMQVRGKFTRALLTPAVDYAEMQTDLDGTHAGSAYKQKGVNLTRRALFADKKIFLIADTLVSTTGSRQYDWLLQGCTGGGTYSSDQATRKALWTKPGGERLLLKMVTPATFNTTTLTEADYIDKNDASGREEPYLRARTNGSTQHYLALLCPLDSGMAEPTITEIGTVAGAVVAKISGGPISGELVVALRTGAAPLVHNADFLADSDALITVYKLDAGGQVEYLAMIDGTTASLDGTAFAINLAGTGTASLLEEPGGPRLYVSTAVPPESSISKWETSMNHGPAGEVTTLLSQGYVECRSGPLSQLRLTFSQPLDPATVNNSSLTIQAQTAGDLSGTVSNISLTSGNTVMVVTLSAGLPEADRFTVTLSDSVKDSAGADLIGDKSIAFARLVGDADGSGTVDPEDMAAIRSNAGRSLDGGYARYDIDGSGRITPADMRAARALDGHALP